VGRPLNEGDPVRGRLGGLAAKPDTRGDSTPADRPEVAAWPEPAGGYKPLSKIGDPVVFSTRDLEAMNLRIARRREQAPEGRPVPVYVPSWASRVVDTGDELLAISKDTGFPYPLDVHADLSAFDHCVVVLRRLFLAGATEPEAERLVRAFGLERGEVARLVREIAEGRWGSTDGR
jgi:hypothetical protein